MVLLLVEIREQVRLIKRVLKIIQYYYFIEEHNFNEKLKSNVKIDKSVCLESKSIEKIRQALYELTYNEIIALLFTPKWREEDEQEKLKIIEEINQENLPATEIAKLIDNIKPKSVLLSQLYHHIHYLNIAYQKDKLENIKILSVINIAEKTKKIRRTIVFIIKIKYNKPILLTRKSWRKED